MATIQNLIDRARGVLNEATAKAWPDTDMVLLGFVAEGLQWMHGQKKAGLEGSQPPNDSPYWRQFFSGPTTLTVLVGTQEIALPADFDVLHSFVDPNTNERLAPYDLSEEHILKRGGRLGVQQGQGYYAFVPSDKVRFILWPGREGAAGVGSHTINIYYWKVMARFTAVGDTITVKDEHATPAINYAVAKGLARFRDSPAEFFEAANSALAGVL